MRLTILAVFALALTACQVRGTGERFMSDAEIEAKDDTTCISFGAKPGSPQYVDCRLRLRTDRSNQDSSRRLRSVLY